MAFVALSLSVVTMAAGHNRNINLITYNVRNCIGMDGVASVERVAEVITRNSPDVVALQELDSVTGRSGGRYVLGEIAAACGMKHFYAPAIDYDGGKYGIGILCKDTPISVSQYALPGAEEARTLLVLEFSDYVFASTHLSLTDSDCRASVDIIRDIAGKSSKPFLIAGDFNAHPDSEVMKDFEKDFTPLSDTGLLNFPADSPVETLDYILLYNLDKRPVKVNAAAVVDEPVASDHRPVAVSVAVSAL